MMTQFSFWSELSSSYIYMGTLIMVQRGRVLDTVHINSINLSLITKVTLDLTKHSFQLCTGHSSQSQLMLMVMHYCQMFRLCRNPFVFLITFKMFLKDRILLARCLKEKETKRVMFSCRDSMFSLAVSANGPKSNITNSLINSRQKERV